MQDRRKTDAEAYRKFRLDRFIKEDGHWYFNTREGTLQGPFRTKPEAQSKLETYIRLVNSAFLPRDDISVSSMETLELRESNPLH